MKDTYSEYEYHEKIWYMEIPASDWMEQGSITPAFDMYNDVVDTYDGYKPALREAIKKLTDKQREVLELHLKGLTQVQIAEKLGCHQTSVHKLLYGNKVYGANAGRYGGVVKKLRKLMMMPKKRRCKEKRVLITVEKVVNRKWKQAIRDFYDKNKDMVESVFDDLTKRQQNILVDCICNLKMMNKLNEKQYYQIIRKIKRLSMKQN
jgi:DNA-binding CsgD family transcriptional regulator